MKWRGLTTTDRSWHWVGTMTQAEARAALGLETEDVERCRACDDQVRMMVFRGTGYCSQLCQNALL